MELESLNTATDEINKLEIELEVSAVLDRKLKRLYGASEHTLASESSHTTHIHTNTF